MPQRKMCEGGWRISLEAPRISRFIYFKRLFGNKPLMEHTPKMKPLTNQGYNKAGVPFIVGLAWGWPLSGCFHASLLRLGMLRRIPIPKSRKKPQTLCFAESCRFLLLLVCGAWCGGRIMESWMTYFPKVFYLG